MILLEALRTPRNLKKVVGRLSLFIGVINNLCCLEKLIRLRSTIRVCISKTFPVVQKYDN